MGSDIRNTTLASPPAPADTDPATSAAPRRFIILTAWALVLLTTGAPIIIMNEVIGADPQWIVYTQFALLVGVSILTFHDRQFRYLQTLVLALLVVKVMKNLPVSEFQQALSIASSGVAAPIVDILLKGAVACLFLGVLLAGGLRSSELFLRRGDLSVVATAQRVPGFRRERPWWRLGVIWGTLTVLTTLLFLLVAGATFALWNLPAHQALVIGLLVMIGAAVNAFQEEFVFRAAPLSQLTTAIGADHAYMLLGAAFGLSHYYGTPGGVPGVLMTFFLGWWLSKSIHETRGLIVAWSVHFLLDVVILTAWLLTTISMQ